MINQLFCINFKWERICPDENYFQVIKIENVSSVNFQKNETDLSR